MSTRGQEVPELQCWAGLSFRSQFFFSLRTALKDSPQGPTADHQLPTAANRHQPPTVTNRQPPTANL